MPATYTRTTVGQSPATGYPKPSGYYNVTIYGLGSDTAATVQLERRLPGETAFRVMSRDTGGTANTFTVSGTAAAFDGVLLEPEAGTEVRLNVLTTTGAGVAWRIGQ